MEIDTFSHSPYWPRGLFQEIIESPSILKKWSSFHATSGEEAKLDNAINARTTPDSEGRSIDALLESLIESSDDIEYFSQQFMFRSPMIRFAVDPDNVGIFSMLRAGARILKIIDKGWNKGCNIRCFEYISSGNLSGDSVNGTQFIPLNCKEIAKSGKYGGSISDVLCLTVTNSESLVFRYDSTQGGSILFTADSDLSFWTTNAIDFQQPAIVTAPHHGSPDNSTAYSKIHKADLTWVRSDSKNIRRPCKEYKQEIIRTMKGYCTLCNSSSKAEQKQPVKLLWKKGSWIPSNTRPCICQ